MCTTSQQMKLVLVEAFNVTILDIVISIKALIKYVAFIRLSFARTYDMNIIGQYNSVHIFISCISIFLFYYYPLNSRRCAECYLFYKYIIYTFFLSSRLLQVQPICPGLITLTISRNEPRYGSP